MKEFGVLNPRGLIGSIGINSSTHSRLGTLSDSRDKHYGTKPDGGTTNNGLKRAASDIMSDIVIYFLPI